MSAGTPRKATPASLSDLLSKDSKDEKDTKVTPVVKENNAEVKENETKDNSHVKENTEVTGSSEAPDNTTNEKPEVSENAPKSSGADNSDSTEYVTTESGTLVDRTNYDNSGNGVTDNMPVGWDVNAPSGTVTTQVPSENASTRHTVVETVYAQEAEVDDKGRNVDAEKDDEFDRDEDYVDDDEDDDNK